MNKLLSFVFFIFTACATDRVRETPSTPVEIDGSTETEEYIDHELAWLRQQQGEDGYWGHGENRALLTGLATLAFLSEAETPASERYGQCIERAISALMHEAELKTDQTEVTKAALTWSLAVAWKMTRIPQIKQALLVQVERLDLTQASPWHVLAVEELLESVACPEYAQRAIEKLRTNLPSQPDDLLNQSAHFLLSLLAEDPQEAKRDFESVQALKPPGWKTHKDPLLTAVMISNSLLWGGKEDWKEWFYSYFRWVLPRQEEMDPFRWWTAEGLGFFPDQLPDFSGAEMDIYVTCMVKMNYSTYRKVHSSQYGKYQRQLMNAPRAELRVEHDKRAAPAP